jgi:hypothetical protein
MPWSLIIKAQEQLHLFLISVMKSAWISAIRAEISHGFTQFLQENTGIIPATENMNLHWKYNYWIESLFIAVGNIFKCRATVK